MSEPLSSAFCLLPPRTTATNKLRLEGKPFHRRNWIALSFCAIANSFCYDWNLRLRTAGLTVSKYIIEGTWSIDPDNAARSLLAHGALRLNSNHPGYAPLWAEQLGDEWREDTPRRTWPALADDDTRWAVRATIDAVVADAYGLDRDQYRHVLSTFSHKSYPGAPDLCLAAFDELQDIGLDAFVRKHDPYHDIPLVETLPKPVIDLPGAETATDADGTERLVEASGQVQLLAPDNGPLFRKG